MNGVGGPGFALLFHVCPPDQVFDVGSRHIRVLPQPVTRT